MLYGFSLNLHNNVDDDNFPRDFSKLNCYLIHECLCIDLKVKKIIRAEEITVLFFMCERGKRSCRSVYTSFIFRFRVLQCGGLCSNLTKKRI